MKHKAQEYLDCLNDENKMDKFAHGFSRDDNYTSQHDYDCAKEYCFEKLNELIDCQLTKEEIEWISQQATFYKSAGVTEERMKLCDSIIDKTEKQKEMWVSDND